ncbi:hypothetical protein [Symbiopectobacterium sp. RP]|uniref:hypothetical protein n=1 Tax=Symbiopectobacterium sp. RP TaxID=3248553 RepID=UPI003D28FF47
MGTSKKQKKRGWLRYRDFVLSPYGIIKIKSLGYTFVEPSVNFAVLCCAVLCCAVLCCAVLCITRCY